MRGAVALENTWLKTDSSKDVAVYVVWSPQLGAQEKHVASATTLIPDVRAHHYWDGEMLVGKLFQPQLGLPKPAWDTWMLFDKDAAWGSDGPPHPAWWEHQLSEGPLAWRLDPARFASHAEALKNILANHR
jgi:hypothetical protein